MTADSRRRDRSRPRGRLVASLVAALGVLASLAAARGQEPESSEQAVRPPLGAPAAWSTADRVTRVLPADAELRAEPSTLSASLLRLDVETEVEVLEERTGWVRVRLGDTRGWVRTGGGDEAGEAEAELDDRRLRRRAERLERARALLDGGGERRRAGTVEWWTDLRDGSRLVERLEDLFDCVPATYRERYGLDRVAYTDRDVVVVFQQEEAYRRFVDAEVEVAELVSGGFSVIAFAALYSGARHADDVAGIAAHELTHLENRRRLALELPPWLEEGLAEDMALVAAAGPGCQVSGWPRVRRREWRTGEGPSATVGVVQTMSGKLRSLACTVASWQQTPFDLERLTTHSWATFSQPEGRSERYSASALLVRYLVEARGGVFRDYLRAGREAGGFSFVELLDRLGLDSDELASRVSVWAAAELDEASCF